MADTASIASQQTNHNLRRLPPSHFKLTTTSSSLRATPYNKKQQR